MARDFYECGSVDKKVKHDHEEKFDKNAYICNKPKVKVKKTKYCNLPINFKKDDDKSKNIIPVYHYQLDWEE